MKDGWDPARGAQLTTYFIGQCLFQYPNVFRRWQNERDQALPAAPEWFDDFKPHGPDVTFVQRTQVDEVLSQMDPLVAEIFTKKYIDGLTYEEIAQHIPGIATARAAENRVTREKKRWQQGKRTG